MFILKDAVSLFWYGPLDLLCCTDADRLISIDRRRIFACLFCQIVEENCFWRRRKSVSQYGFWGERGDILHSSEECFWRRKCESARLWRGRRDPSPSSIPQQQNMQHLGMNLSKFNFIRRLPSSFNKCIHNIHHCWRSLYWGWVGIITHSVTAWMEGGRLANFHNRLLCCCCF